MAEAGRVRGDQKSSRLEDLGSRGNRVRRHAGAYDWGSNSGGGRFRLHGISHMEGIGRNVGVRVGSGKVEHLRGPGVKLHVA